MIKALITNKDIKAINNKLTEFAKVTADEANLLQVAKWSEFQIQSACRNIFKSGGFGNNAIFLQIDNGGSSIEGIRKKKGAMGTISGFCDVEIKIWKIRKGTAYNEFYRMESEVNLVNRKSIYIEFKRIGGKIAENQQKWHEFLKEKGESVYYCNNILFFEKIIMKEIEEFLK